MGTPEDLAAELAREIRAAVAEAGPAEAGLAAEPPSEEFSDIRHSLSRAEAHITPAIPEASRLARPKSAALRLLRFLWRGQASFNTLLLEAATGVVGALEKVRGELERQTRRSEELARELGRLGEEESRRSSGQDIRIAHLETLVSRDAPALPPGAESGRLPESVYAIFEERFRGSSAEVAEKQRFYLRFLRDLSGPVFDAGCGRGEFLRLLKEENITARGVESSSLAAAACRATGLDVREGDAIEALSATPPATLGAVVAFQVVEHWPASATFRFLAAASRALVPGGLLIVETVNTDSLAAMNAFYLDPTHVRPVPPEALRFLCDAAGFRDLRIEYLNPLPAVRRLEERSENDARLNSMLFGPQDYAVIGWIPRA